MEQTHLSAQNHIEKKYICVRIWGGICVCLSIILLYVFQTTFVQGLDTYAYDTFLRLSAGGKPSSKLLFVDIDEESLKEFGQWPWPRHMTARMVGTLKEHGASAIGLDLLFMESDRSAPQDVLESFRNRFGMTIPLETLPENMHVHDRILASVVAQSPTVLGMFVISGDDGTAAFFEDTPPEEVIVMHASGNEDPLRYVYQEQSASVPLAELRTAAPMGAINTFVGDDGVVRDLPLVLRIQDRLAFSLSLRTFMRSLDTSEVQLINNSEGLSEIHVGKHVIPVKPNGSIAVPFRYENGAFDTVSAADILNNTVKSEDIEGRICIVGTSAVGLYDIVATPLGSTYAGAEVHLMALDAMLDKDFMAYDEWLSWKQVSVLLFVGLALTLLLCRTAPLVSLCTFVVGLGSVLVGTWTLFQNGLFFSPVYLIILMTLLTFCMALTKAKKG